MRYEDWPRRESGFAASSARPCPWAVPSLSDQCKSPHCDTGRQSALLQADDSRPVRDSPRQLLHPVRVFMRFPLDHLQHHTGLFPTYVLYNPAGSVITLCHVLGSNWSVLIGMLAAAGSISSPSLNLLQHTSSCSTPSSVGRRLEQLPP